MVRRHSLVEVLNMTTNALGRKPKAIELSNGSHLVTGIAIHDSVRADEGKAILVLIDVVDRNLPAVRVMA
jgi:hypothetical protein